MRVRLLVALAVAAAAVTLVAAGALAQNGGPNGTPKGQAAKQNAALFAVLTGRKEVDAQGNRRVGDPDGRGSFTAIVDDGQMCFGITVKNIDTPVAAHVHRGRPNQFGGIVIPLTHPADGDPGASSGCVAVDPTLSAAILKSPHKYYANVHTGPFPGGAVRGQLFRRSN